jgi:trehalose 6-phosphate phosphatase
MIDDALTNALERITSGRGFILASDYDGTLSPLVDDPAAAVPNQRSLASFIRISMAPGVDAVIISGRSIEILESLTHAPPNVTLIGTHGAQSETSAETAQLAGTVRQVTLALWEVSRLFDGTEVEPKPVGAAFHYRRATHPDDASKAALSVAHRFGARAIEGKMVVELVLGEGDKGSALTEFRLSHRAKPIVFFGDDSTDEDVFVMLDEQDVGVKVGPERSAARFRVTDTDDVAAALALIESRVV